MRVQEHPKCTLYTHLIFWLLAGLRKPGIPFMSFETFDFGYAKFVCGQAPRTGYMMQQLGEGLYQVIFWLQNACCCKWVHPLLQRDPASLTYFFFITKNLPTLHFQLGNYKISRKTRFVGCTCALTLYWSFITHDQNASNDAIIHALLDVAEIGWLPSWIFGVHWFQVAIFCSRAPLFAATMHVNNCSSSEVEELKGYKKIYISRFKTYIDYAVYPLV